MNVCRALAVRANAAIQSAAIYDSLALHDLDLVDQLAQRRDEILADARCARTPATFILQRKSRWNLHSLEISVDAAFDGNESTVKPRVVRLTRAASGLDVVRIALPPRCYYKWWYEAGGIIVPEGDALTLSITNRGHTSVYATGADDDDGIAFLDGRWVNQSA